MTPASTKALRLRRIPWGWPGVGLALAAGSAAVLTVNVAQQSGTSQGKQVTGSGSSGSGSAAAASGKDKDSAKDFTITGTVTGLFPGATRPLALTVSNPNSQSILVQTITVAVHDAGAGCPADNLVVGSFTPFTVPARSSGNTTMPVTLDPSAAPSCELVSWPLVYSGTAVKA